MIVLGSTIWSGRYQRLKESVLLRTFGASRWQIWKILCAGIFVPRSARERDRDRARAARELGAGGFHFKLGYYAVALADTCCAAMVVSSLTVAVGLLTSYGVGVDAAPRHFAGRAGVISVYGVASAGVSVAEDRTVSEPGAGEAPALQTKFRQLAFR